MSTTKDIAGKRYGWLTALSPIEDSTPRKWLLKCGCGNTVTYSVKRLNAGRLKSCGCKIALHRQTMGQIYHKRVIGIDGEFDA